MDGAQTSLSDWPDGGPPAECSCMACNVMQRPVLRLGVTRGGSASGADLGRSSEYSIGRKAPQNPIWVRLRTGAEQFPVSTAVECGSAGRKPSVKEHRSHHKAAHATSQALGCALFFSLAQFSFSECCVCVFLGTSGGHFGWKVHAAGLATKKTALNIPSRWLSDGVL